MTIAAGSTNLQLRVATTNDTLFEGDEAFRDKVLERFAQRDDVAALASGWNQAQAAEMVVTTVEDGSLPLLASFLWTQEPAGWEFALGVALAAFMWDQAEEARAGVGEINARYERHCQAARAIRVVPSMAGRDGSMRAADFAVSISMLNSFSFVSSTPPRNQIRCWLLYTNERVRELVRENIDRSPLFNGWLTAQRRRFRGCHAAQPRPRQGNRRRGRGIY